MKTLVRELGYHISSKNIFDKLHTLPMAVYLDSSLENKLGKYSIIAYKPYLTVKECSGTLFVNDEPRKEKFEDFMSEYLKENYEENPYSLPLISGCIGYLSYDYGRKFENIATKHSNKNHEIPEALFCFYENFIIEDLEKRKIYISSKSEDGLNEIEQLIKSDDLHLVNSKKFKASYTSDFEEQNYIKAIGAMIKYIIEGDIYITNMTRQINIKSDKEPYTVFEDLRKSNPSPFGGYFNYVDFQIVSASPERFILMEDSKIETRPIKGTIRRGKNEEEDRILKTELESSQKDRSELLMIVDLERNDLNRVCIPGSVKVTENFAIEEYATVFHLVSTVTGELRQELGIMDLIKSVFPGGSITGAPKIRAMEIIDELENSPRGLYTGSMGYISLNGKCDLNIVIRTLLHKSGDYLLGVGGGITCESDPTSEYLETCQKAKALLRALECEIYE